MKVVNFQQGTQEWLNHRDGVYNASEAPAMMGEGYISRDELIEQYATGIKPEVTESLQRLFDKGHEAEAAIRPHVEAIIEESLYPVVAVADDGAYPSLKKNLGSSYDGLTMMENIAFEHKLWNAELAERVRLSRETGECQLTGRHFWQLEHQVATSKDANGLSIEKIIFVVSDGTPENMEWMWYAPVPGRIEQIEAGWVQFEKDVEAYKPVETKSLPRAQSVGDLPAVVFQMNGLSVRTDFYDAFKPQAMKFINLAAKPMIEDQDFANGKKLVAAFEKAEKYLAGKADEVINEISDIAKFRSDLIGMAELMRESRLSLNKRVEDELKARKLAIQNAARESLVVFVAELESDPCLSTEFLRLPRLDDGIVAATKGKRTLDSFQQAANDAVASAKIAYQQQANQAKANVWAMQELAGDNRSLFADLQQTVFKSTEDFRNMVASRIAKQKAAEVAKLEAERERIRKEEEAKARAEMERQQAEERKVAEASQKPVISLHEVIQAVAPEPIASMANQWREVDPKSFADSFNSTPLEKRQSYLQDVASKPRERIAVTISTDLVERLKNLASIECPLQKLAIECLEDMGLEVPEMA